jgi:tripartite-type tricarboxylate transporter receptor subunit TctC
MLRPRLLLAFLTFCAGPICAQSWPVKPVRVVVAFTAGGTTDVLARRIGQQLGDPVGGTPQQFAAFVQREFEKWRVVVRESGATAQ